MIVAITGGTGFIGNALVEALKARGDQVRLISRSRGPYLWDPLAGPPPAETLHGADAVVHLAGESVSQYWTAAAKQRIKQSRVVGTRNLVAGLRGMSAPPRVLISASAVGFYGDRGDEVLDESSAPGTGFLPEVSEAWEHEANAAAGLGVRVVTKRTGVVLHPGGGALAKMLLPFKLGLGGRLGSGRQWMPWIHLNDQIGLTLFALDSADLAGPVNAVAPGQVTNAEFVRSLGRALGRPAAIPAPEFALKLALGEMSQILLSSQRVVPRALERAGYKFRYPGLADALTALYL